MISTTSPIFPLTPHPLPFTLHPIKATSMSQSAAKHARMLPPYHYVAGPILFANFVTALWQFDLSRGWSAILQVLLAIALILLYFFARVMVLTVQDRVIRLEERLRLARLLPADLQGRIEEFTVGQLVALRFASDAELPALAARVLQEKITDKKVIKGMVKEWKADYLRA
jgi:hypothetical protein